MFKYTEGRPLSPVGMRVILESVPWVVITIPLALSLHAVTLDPESVNVVASAASNQNVHPGTGVLMGEIPIGGPYRNG